MNFKFLLLFIFLFLHASYNFASGNECVNTLASETEVKSIARSSLSLPYTQASQEILPVVLLNTKNKIIDFKNNGYSRKDAKFLRKYILLSRLYFEILGHGFSQAYSPDSIQASWKLLREGYKLLGTYKGSDIKATKKNERKKQSVITWVDKYLSSVSEIVDGIKTQPLSISQQLIKFPGDLHWDMDLINPNPKEQLNDTLKNLSLKLLEKSFGETEDLINTQNFLDTEDAEAFHDFRKQMRVIIKVHEMFPGLYSKSASLNWLVEFVWELGQLNDEIENWQKATNNDIDVILQTQLEVKVNKKWQRLKKLFPKHLIEENIKIVSQTIIDQEL